MSGFINSLYPIPAFYHIIILFYSF
jgi:hypothetical protein